MEIKPQDVRVGNKLIRDGIVVTIDARSIFDLAYSPEIAVQYKPIELTPEWLERFGFEYEKQTNGGYERWEIKTTKGRRIKLLDKKFTWGVGEYSDYILHVHQLQNLYFALTGEELAIDKTSLKN